jgi:Tol biopolymer transport system component
VDALGFAGGGDFFFSTGKRWFSAGIGPFNLDDGRADLDATRGILGSNMLPDWSPDGGRLVFVPELETPRGVGRPYHRPLHVYEIVSGTTRELASSLQTRNPRWSPDGRSILFCGRDTLRDTRTGEGGLYVVDVESGEFREVVDLDPATHTSFWSDLGGVWSHDGDAIIYALYDFQVGEGRLVWKDLESGEERVLYRDPRLTTRLLDLSPDGARLVFAQRSEAKGYTSGIHSGGSILVMDLASGDLREIHRVPDVPGQRVWSLQWAPDGKHVFFTKRGDGHRTWIWRVPVSGGTAERLWTFPEDHYDGYIKLSPDGRKVALSVYHQDMELWVMENLTVAGQGSNGTRYR